jgi:hypothetical protein
MLRRLDTRPAVCLLDGQSFSIDEESRRRYERARTSGSPQPIEAFLPPEGDPRFLGTLEELVQIELEKAWKSWSQMQLDMRVRRRRTSHCSCRNSLLSSNRFLSATISESSAWGEMQWASCTVRASQGPVAMSR